MFFELGDSKKGIITSISFDVSKLDKDVRNHLQESLGKNIKVADGKIILKTNMTLDDLTMLNNGYNEFHSKFILKNVIHFERQAKVESIKEESVKGKNVSIVEQKTVDDGNVQKLADETINDDVHSHSL
jgi:hypothetical protein